MTSRAFHRVPDHLGRVEQEALAYIQAARERVVSQLYAAAWSVTAACEHAREGRRVLARVEAKRASDLLYAATESAEPVAVLMILLGAENDWD